MHASSLIYIDTKTKKDTAHQSHTDPPQYTPLVWVGWGASSLSQVLVLRIVPYTKLLRYYVLNWKLGNTESMRKAVRRQ